MHLSSAQAAPTTAWPSQPGRLLGLACGLFALTLLIANPNYQWTQDRPTPFGADFVQEWVAGDMLLSGAAAQVYDRTAFQTWQHDENRLGFTWPESQYYPAVYPPAYYCVVAPLAYLPYRVSATLWLGLLVAAYGCSAWLAMRCWTDRPSMRAAWFWCAGLLLPAMFFGCVLGQKGSMWLLVLTATTYLLKHQRPRAAGCVAALLTLKPTLCGLLPVAMILSGQWRFTGGFLGTTIMLYGGSALVLPYSMWNDYLQVVLGASEYQAHAGYRSGWSTSIATLFSAAAVPRIISAAVIVVSAAGLLVHIVVRSRHSAGGPLAQPESLWSLIVGTALLSPHAYFYDLTWILLPLSAWIDERPRRALRCLGIVWIGMVLGQSFEFGLAIPAIALVIAMVPEMIPQISGR